MSLPEGKAQFRLRLGLLSDSILNCEFSREALNFEARDGGSFVDWVTFTMPGALRWDWKVIGRDISSIQWLGASHSRLVLVGGDWNMTGLLFSHSVGNVIIQIDEL